MTGIAIGELEILADILSKRKYLAIFPYKENSGAPVIGITI
jgi:hypothetical protein